MATRTYTIPEYKVDAFARAVERLAMKADAADCERPTMEIVGYDLHPMAVGNPNAAAAFYRVARVEVTNPAVVGKSVFKLVGTIQHESTGNILWLAPDERDAGRDLRRFRDGAPVCEHCKVDRRRGDTFLVGFVGSDAVIQVGRDCMLEVTGIKPATVALVVEVDDLDGMGLDNDATWPVGSHHYPAGMVLGAIAAQIRECGYLSAAKAQPDEATTSMVISRALSGFPMRGTSPEVLRIIREHRAEGDDAVVARGTGRMAAAIDRDACTDFEANVAVACGGESIAERSVSIACAAVSMYLRAREAERLATMGKVSGHFGAVGDRITSAKLTKKAREAGTVHHAPMAATVASVRVFDGMFGRTWLVKLLADSGHVLTWRASTEVTAKAGDRVVVEGSIKAHSEYNGTPETVLTRAGLREME